MINFNEHSAVLMSLPNIINDIKEIERKINHYKVANTSACVAFDVRGQGTEVAIRFDNDIIIDTLWRQRQRFIDKLREVGINYGDSSTTSGT